MLKEFKIYDGRDFNKEDFVGTVTFDDDNADSFWRLLNILSLPGAFRRLEMNKTTLVYEDTARMGNKDSGCTQNNCVDVDEDPHACQYCPYRTKGDDAYIFLPEGSIVEIVRDTKVIR